MRKDKRIGPNIRTLANATIDKLIKEGRASVVPDFEYTYESQEERIRKREELRKEAERIEKERIDKILCPSCKSTNKKHVIKRESNGVLGPGHATWTTDEYFVCKDCGTRYEDISKMKDDDE